MATGVIAPVSLLLCCTVLVSLPEFIVGRVLTPPYFNLAQGRNITATATCGVGVANPELYCRLTGSSGSGTNSRGRSRPSTVLDEVSLELIRGQLCDYCNPSNPEQDHRPEYATDGTERWWQSPPLSRLGVELNKVNLTISLGQEFHVAYVFIKMANSPRPGVWVLERSTDFGATWEPWQYFADTPSDCANFFNTAADERISSDDQILCTTEFSKVVPLSNGEIVVSLVNGRPNALNFSYADTLQEWTKATDVQLRLLRTKTLLGHLMAVARQDPTVTRRYYYSIKDISIGGRCVCNGHAQTCDTRDPTTTKLLCDCEHFTCGEQCNHCCPGYTQKRWRRAIIDQPFMCEPCECYGHSDECIFDDEVERTRRSIDIHGIYEGGGVCQNCRDNTMGINCEQCVSGYYRPLGVPRNATDACRPCECDLRVSTGECEEGSGRCLCRPEYAGVNCDRCNFGYYGYPDCIPCECDVNGTEGAICYVTSGNCPCKPNYDGRKCDQCALGFYNFPECIPCECSPVGSPTTVCGLEDGLCQCLGNYGGRDCGECADGYFRFPQCEYCNCDPSGTVEEICDKQVGTCMCRENYAGDRCDRCAAGYFNFPTCQQCQCSDPGSLSPVCAENGQCRCAPNFGGLSCQHCAPGYYKYPDCIPCNCDFYGSLAQTCDQVSGQCHCRSNFVGVMCDTCGESFYNYPVCEVCNCNPNGAKQIPGYPLGGCGIVTSGLLCECKDRVMGRICDTCKPGYWNLNRNNPDGCEECECFKPGTLAGVNKCDMNTGQCVCKPDVGGQDCDQCLDGFYNLDGNNPFGCVDCNCDRGGSQRLTCDKTSGQCLCKQRVTGKRCDVPITGHFVPSLHQYKFEVEDGTTPEGARIRYGYDTRIFPDFSWRGYAVLTQIQPEVQLDVDIRIPSLYQIIFRFVNREDGPVKGTVTLKPDAPTDITQTGEITFVPSRDPKFATVTSGGVQSFVLNPGRWTISTNVPDNVFLDYFVLIPQSYYEASQLQVSVTNPCLASGDIGPCLSFKYPDIDGFPTGLGENAYVVENNQRKGAEQHPDIDLTYELDSSGLAHVNEQQKSFLIDLVVPEPGDYFIVVSYHNPRDVSQNLDVDVATVNGRDNAQVTLSSCPYSSLCRQVLKGEDGLEAVFDISSGYATLYFTGGDGVDLAIDAVYGIPVRSWSADYILPRIICIKINGICVPSTYGRPVGAVRIDFEQDRNKDLQATVLPPNILDPSVGLVNLNDTIRRVVPLDLFGQVTKPGQYILLVHYYMPTEVGLNIPVSVHSDGKVTNGMFKPRFCPNNVGCRSTIMFGQSGGNVIKLTGTDIKVSFNGTKGGQIWLDYLLIVPMDQYHKDYMDLLPVDKSGDFLNMCVDEGFQLKADEEFCKNGAFTLVTNFNNGALDCNCNADGSLSFTCDGFGGQCQCRDYIIGRTCSACLPGYYGFPNCQACNCRYGLCHEVTGECICPPRVEGDQCDRCEPEAYGYDALIGCQRCNCDYQGVLDRNLNCDQRTGQCSCKANIGERRCDTCLPGYHTFPFCEFCGCDTRGTQAAICDQRTAQCLCKDNVVGTMCDQCADGMYNLEMDNPKGCTQCFCFGHTTRCDSSNLNWDFVYDMRGWLATNTGDEEVQEAGSTIRISSVDGALDEDNIIYWIAPPAYLGKKINSYGGLLQFTVLFTLPRGLESEGLIEPDIILSGSNMSVVHYHNTQPLPSTSFDMEVPLTEYHFRHQGTNAPVFKEQFMMILSSLDALLIRASYYTVVGEIRLTEVYLEQAAVDGRGDPADSVEMCQCPPNYVGLSCEDCAPGYYRARTSPYLGICVKCNCNGHSNECDLETGECLNCQDNTTGTNCEQCMTGYYGDPATGGCQICSCPLPVPSNNFATTCQVSADGYTTTCSCLPGYTGAQCQSCDSGYFGDPINPNNYCQPCGCNGNIDISNPGSCDRFTGSCLICENYSSGSDCGECRDWYWGDAISRKDCQRCSCDTCGSDSCDKTFGVCQCKLNVIGNNCDECRPYTWGFESCTGCSDCECGVGSVSPQCDVYTGVCECHPGVEGTKCDRCRPGYWNYGPGGCQECNCLSDGAVGCDPETGRCECLPGVTGSQCDRCLPRWVLVPNRGCQECDYCIHLLLDDLDTLHRNVSVVSRQLGEVSVGVGAFNQLAIYNDTIKALRPDVDALSNMDTDSFKALLVPVEDEMRQLEQDARNVGAQADAAVFEANQIPGDVENLLRETSELQGLVSDLNGVAEDTLRYINDVRRQILDTSSIRNIDYFITEGERILNEIKDLSFAAQNESSVEEIDFAMKVLEDVRSLKEQAMNGMNHTKGLGADVADMASRLYDLQNSSRYSVGNAETALSTIRRLRAVEVETLSRSSMTIKDAVMDREEFLKSSTDLLTKAEMMLTDATDAVEDVARESSKMESATPELETRVNEIASSLDDLLDVVNRSQIHSEGLVGIAEDLDELYESTRDISGNAVKAGQAYKNILDAIDQARVSADDALFDAKIAQNESLGVGDNVTMSLEYSQDLLTEAEELYDKTQMEFFDRKTEAEVSVNEATDDNSMVRQQLDTINSQLELLKNQKTDAFGTLMDKATDAEAQVDEVVEKSKPIIDDMADIENKMNFILQNKPKISDNMRQSKDNLDSSEKNRPEVESLLNSLSLNADKLVETSNDVEVSVKSLKEKIARARDEANRIRVGLRFLGNTTVTLRNPPMLEDTGSYSKVSVFFKTTQADALLLYIGNNQNMETVEFGRVKRSAVEEVSLSRSVRQTAEFESDYMALELRGGRVVFTFNLGSGSARIISDRLVNDGKWHQAMGQRIGKTGSLTVKSNEQDDEIKEGTSQGTFAVLELNKLSTLFLVGGLPDDVKIPRDITTQMFEGGMEDLKFDGEPVGLWNFVAGENNYEGEQERDFLKQIFTEGVRFNGMGYAVLSKGGLRLKPDRTRMSLYFKTFAEDGLLFYMGEKDYFSVETRRGKVIFQYDLGGGAAIMETSDSYNDGQWHQITIDRDKRNAILIIDERIEEITTESKGNLNNLETTNDIYFGGIDNVLIPSPSVISTGFDGCLKDIVVGSVAIDLFDNKRAKGVVKGCAPKVTHLVSFPSTRSGYIGLEPVNVGSAFDVTFKMRTLSKNALLMFTSDRGESNIFSVAVSDGRIVVSEELGSLSSQLTSRINTYGDGQWHYISIMKMGRKLTMSIDDSEMVESQSVPGELITERPLYFGGLPLDFVVISQVVPTTQGLDGCMGDITINKKFQNLANLYEGSGITLAECSVEPAGEPEVQTTISPDQCSLMPVPSDIEDPEADVSGVRFGAFPYSRQEYRKLPVRIRLRSVIISISFKTTAKNGVIFYSSDVKHIDFIGLYMLNGQINYGFNCGSGSALITSPEAYNDGKWHTVKFSRRRQDGSLEIDGERVGIGRSPGGTRSLNTKPPHYVGGLPEEKRKKAINNLGDGYTGFIGCLKDITLNMLPIGRPTKDVNVQTCSSDVEDGTFVGSGGGYVQLYDKFKVGRDLEISMDIKPRSQEGILLGVHGNRSDFLLLQMSNGEIIFTVDNGAGPITIRYTPQTRNTLCDGRWHNIRATKTRHILMLAVDGINVGEPQEGKKDVSAADTNDPLYIGGVADLTSKGILANGDFVGCIRNVKLNNDMQYIATGTPTGDIRIDACPLK
ncbi:laminin subunit alpha isoform X2 [Aplysia californica]|uniref:Laminin subunit alpha isoform X2 n=1 Tax=Aplysia californica TaxID=6500 RepID=A0ABM1A931_APLCA|nr:laminin subunit alpha isoform X2 [Aplysia californica]